MKDFLGFFLLLSKCCSKVTGSALIETLYLLSSISRWVLKSYEPRNLLDRDRKGYLFSTRCMNIMLPKMFNWYIFNIFCSLKISLVCANLFLLKIMRIVCFCWLLIFFKVCPAGTAPSYIGIVDVGLYI